MSSSRTIPLSAWSSALIAALIGFGGTVALVVHAVQVMGGSPSQTISAVTALCIGVGVAGAALSFVYRMPVALAWSTPGAALIGASAMDAGWPIAIGAFMAAGAMMTVLGLVPALGRLAAKIPLALASAMLAGVLLPFCLALFGALESDLLVAGVLLAVFVIVRQRFPLYAVLVVLGVALAIVLARGELADPFGATWFGTLEPVVPAFSLSAIVGLAAPLFLVTLVSQNLPGLMVLRSAGYDPPAQPILLVSGLATMLMAPFGAQGVNMAAITAAICVNPEAHPDRAKRWIVGVLYGCCYLLLALFSAPLVSLFLALPRPTVAAIIGIALIPPLLGAMEGMTASPDNREAAMLTFVATASGVVLGGLGSSFWGLVVGVAALGVGKALRRSR